MRRAPYHSALVNQQRLRRFVAHTEPLRNRVRQLAMRLHCDDGIARVELVLVEVFDQLVERFGARAAGDAVLEEQQGTVGRLVQQLIELLDPLQAGDVWVRDVQRDAPAAA